MDKGLTLSQIDGLFETAGPYVDIVKLGWGTSYVTANLADKLARYRSNDVELVCGGTLLEVAELRGKLDAYRSWLSETGFSCVEVSDGTIDMTRERKLEIIELFARDFRVLSEVGSKLDATRRHPRRAVGVLDPRGAGRRRLEGDHRGPRVRHRRHLRQEERHGRAV